MAPQPPEKLMCGQVLELLEQYVDGELTEAVADGVTAHTEHCQRCASELDLAAELEQAGWYRMVTVRDDTDTVYVLAIEGDGVIHGLTAMVFDEEGEVVLVNIAGAMDPETVGSVISNMDDLDDLGVDFG